MIGQQIILLCLITVCVLASYWLTKSDMKLRAAQKHITALEDQIFNLRTRLESAEEENVMWRDNPPKVYDPKR